MRKDKVRGVKKLYMHIGVPKTGTSSLQTFLFNNRALLKEKGIFYPETVNGWVQHAELWPLSLKNKYINNTSNIPFKKYKEQIDASQCNAAIISSELFCISSSIEDYVELTSNYNTTYIVYVRSPLPFAQSLMLQNIVNYYLDSAHDMSRLLATNKLTEYISCQLDWITRFFHGMPCSKNVIIKSYDLAYEKGNLIQDFCSAIGIEDLGGFPPATYENAGLSVDAYYFLAHLAMLPLHRSKMQAIEKELHELSQSSVLPASRHRLFSRKQMESIPQTLIQRYEELGKQIGRPDLWQSGLEAMLKLEECPWRQLPADKQWEIYENLSPRSREAIAQVWPVEKLFPGILRGSGFLPDIPEDEKTACLMRRWRMFFETASGTANRPARSPENV